ncbi:salicylate synthase [Kineosporia mesophila]|uniref:salicylate synthase n=1 Tax=Kineosporia mesophila TaxID=566012 RepID=UPI001E56E539|nr:salicylate synthase [Kineosporia mesophila]
MSVPVGYQERTVPFGGDPIEASTRFARQAQGPVTVYEQDGAWLCGSGALAEVVLHWNEIRWWVDGLGWTSEPVGDEPLSRLAQVLAALPVPGWRACGWAGFELGPRAYGLAGPVTPDPLVHLIVPAQEIRFEPEGARLRARTVPELEALESLLGQSGTLITGRPQMLADLDHEADRYQQQVARAVADIHAGRLRKVIVSRAVPVQGEIDLAATYEQGRRGNTPARSFLIDIGNLAAVGFSPETVVEVSAQGRISTQPLAGTAALEGSAEADGRRREALLRDPKEIYEHAISVQAAQDELRPLCESGTLVVDEFMNVLERGSVQHLASRVSGRLAAGRDAWQALAVVFPAITATGVPKAAALEAIREYEQPRGVYSGAVVNTTSDGALDAALVLRTVFRRDGQTWLRAGAGIVGASRPERELEETREKLRSISRFLVPAGSEQAENGLEALRRTVAGLIEEDPAEVGDDDNLFELGLESIALITAVGQWRREGIQVSFAELAESPTVEGWYKLLADRRTVPVAPEPLAVPAGTGDEFPLALMQHAYWIGRSTAQTYGGVAAHLFTEFDGDDVEPDRLAAAIERVVVRHPALRTRVTDNGAQIVEETSGWRGLDVHDLRDLPEDEVGERLEAVRDRLSHEMLDIERGELLATVLSLLPGGRTRFHLDVDMVAADAVSYRILLADLAQAYSQGPESLPAHIDYSYRRYREENAPGHREAAERGREAWQHRLPGLPGAPQLPLAPPGLGTPKVSRRHFRLSPEARESLAQTARRHSVTPAMAVATAFAEVLGAWSSQSRFLLNVPLFDREQLHPDVGRIIGDFTSSVLLEIDLTDRVPFSERARGVQTRLHADAAHAAYSGVEVLRDLGRQQGEPVLAPMVFTSALGLGELFDASVGEQFGRPVWIISQGPQVLLDAQVTELDGGLLINWDIRENTFAPGVVDAMFSAFEHLVRGLSDGSTWQAPVGNLTDPAQRPVNPGPTSERLLHQGFFEQAAQYPDRAALVWPGGELSYGALADQARGTAGALIARGVRPGDAVGVHLPKGPEQIVAVMGVLAAGGVYVPVGVQQPPARIARIAQTAGIQVAITSLPQNWPASVATGEGLHDHEGVSAGDGRLDEAAYLLFTSGSTGAPKGVEVSHRAAMNTIDDLVDRLGIGPDDRTLAVSALDFDLSVFDVFAPLSAGGAVVLVDEESRREATVWAGLIAGGVTILNCVPTVLDLVLSSGVPLGDSLRAVLLGGDRIGTDLPARLASAVPGARFLALGGTTETAIHSTICEIRDAVVDPGWTCVPYGTPLRNVRLRVVDALGRDCPDHVTGELWIGGPGVALGYRGDPDRTADRFVSYDGERWYRTGDLARYRPAGTVEFLGRADHQVKIRGFRVELGEVEAALSAVPGVRAGVAVLVPGKPASLGALVVADEQPREIRDALGALLPAHMVPDRMVRVEALPLSANGKIDRRAAAALLERESAERQIGAAGPRTDLERVILLAWQEILGTDGFGIDDEFFALGGDSVLATRLVARLREELDSSAPSVRLLFGAPTTATFARALNETEPGRLERIAAIVWEIAGLSDDEIETRLQEPDTRGGRS